MRSWCWPGGTTGRCTPGCSGSSQALAVGPPEQVAARLREYAAAGARHFACRIATTSLATQREQLEELIKLKPILSGQ